MNKTISERVTIMDIYIKHTVNLDKVKYDIKIEGEKKVEMPFYASQGNTLCEDIRAIVEKNFRNDFIKASQINQWTIEYSIFNFNRVLLQYKRSNPDVFVAKFISSTQSEKKYCLVIDEVTKDTTMMYEWANAFKYIRHLPKNEVSQIKITTQPNSNTKSKYKEKYERFAVRVSDLEQNKFIRSDKDISIGVVFQNGKYYSCLRYADKTIFRDIDTQFSLDISTILKDCKKIYDFQHINLLIQSKSILLFKYNIFNENTGIDVYGENNIITKIKFEEGINNRVINIFKNHQLPIGYLKNLFNILKSSFEKISVTICKITIAPNSNGNVQIQWDEVHEKPYYYILYRKSKKGAFSNIRITKDKFHVISSDMIGYYIVLASSTNSYVYNNFSYLPKTYIEKATLINTIFYPCEITIESKGDNKIALTWEQCPESFAKSPMYLLYRKVDNDHFRKIQSTYKSFSDVYIGQNTDKNYKYAVVAVNRNVPVELPDDYNYAVDLSDSNPININDEYFTSISKCRHHLWRVLGVNDEEVMLKCTICRDINFVKRNVFFKDYRLNKVYETKLPKPLSAADVIVLSSSKRCTNLNHTIENYIGVLPVATKEKQNNIEVDLGYCRECNLYIMLHSTYNKIVGNPICMVRDLITNKIINKANSGFWIESNEHILHRLGYNVRIGNGLSSIDRQQILAKIINNNILSKNEIISHLEYCINMASGREHLNVAIAKWQADLDFVRKLNTNAERIAIKSLTLKFPK